MLGRGGYFLCGWLYFWLLLWMRIKFPLYAAPRSSTFQFHVIASRQIYAMSPISQFITCAPGFSGSVSGVSSIFSIRLAMRRVALGYQLLPHSSLGNLTSIPCTPGIIGVKAVASARPHAEEQIGIVLFAYCARGKRYDYRFPSKN